MALFGIPPEIICAWLFVLGAVTGSFLNVCIYRIPQHERFLDQLRGLVSPPSTCPGCGNRIPGVDNIPILGWLKLLGRCRFCKMPISPRYPLIELFNGLLFVLVYWYMVPTGYAVSLADTPFFASSGLIADEFSRTSAMALLHWRYAYHMVLLEALLVASFIDIDLKIIPDGCTLPAMAVGVSGAFALGNLQLVPIWIQEPSIMRTLKMVFPDVMAPLFNPIAVPEWITEYPHLHGLAVSLAGLVVGGGAVWTVRIIGQRILRQEAMGFGDVILMAMIGSFVGWQPALVIFFVAPLCALVVVAVGWIVRRDREIPYGPYLALSTLLVLLGWQTVWPIAERIFETGPIVPFMGLFMAVMLAVCLQLMQLVKRLLGIPLYPDEWLEEWTSADQLHHFAGENVDALQGNWRTEQWKGVSTGRGLSYHQQWRHGNEK